MLNGEEIGEGHLAVGIAMDEIKSQYYCFKIKLWSDSWNEKKPLSSWTESPTSQSPKAEVEAM